MGKMQKHSFIKSSEGATASYNFIDLATGTGIKNFYAIYCDTTKFLSNSVSDAFSLSTTTTVTGQTATFTTLIDQDYDIEFRLPQTVEGTALFQGSFLIYGNITTNKARFLINLYRVDTGNTEHLIGTATGNEFTYTGTYPAAQYERGVITIDCTKTHLAIGEKLRLNVQLQGLHNDVSGGITLGLYHDPKNLLNITTSNSSKNSDLLVSVPFNIDL